MGVRGHRTAGAHGGRPSWWASTAGARTAHGRLGPWCIAASKRRPRGRRYARQTWWIVVQPFVDQHYRTLTDRCTARPSSAVRWAAVISHYAINEGAGRCSPKAGVFSPSYLGGAAGDRAEPHAGVCRPTSTHLHCMPAAAERWRVEDDARRMFQRPWVVRPRPDRDLSACVVPEGQHSEAWPGAEFARRRGVKLFEVKPVVKPASCNPAVPESGGPSMMARRSGRPATDGPTFSGVPE